MSDQSFRQAVIIGMDDGSIERVLAAVYSQETDRLTGLHFGQARTEALHERLAVRDFPLLSVCSDLLGSLFVHSRYSFQHLDVGMEYIDARFGDGSRNRFVKSFLKFLLRQFALVGAESQSGWVDLKDLTQWILEAPSQPHRSAMPARDLWQLHQRRPRHAIRITARSIDQCPVQRTFARLLHQFRDGVDQVTSSNTIGKNHQRDLMFMNPLA